jgi:predicted Rossmann fold flavoprotein
MPWQTDIYDLAVAGAGPAGLFAAQAAPAQIKKILLLEKQPAPGCKLLLTGSGQCNFTNQLPLRDFPRAYGEHGAFLKPALQHFAPAAAREFFRRQGVESLVVAGTGKVFPRSRRAQDVLAALLKRCRARGVELLCRQPVTGVRLLADGIFQITSGTRTFGARRLLLATGGRSYPATGSSGDGYALAAALGHTVVQPRPGLTSFTIRDFSWAGLAGTSGKDLPVTLWRRDEKVKTLTGDWLITHKGLSGPVVQNLSRYARPGDRVTLALAPCIPLDKFQRDWESLLARGARLTLKAWLKHFYLSQAMARFLLDQAGLSPAQTVGRLRPEQRAVFFAWLTAYPLSLQSLGDFNSAMVTVGGVALGEVNPKTLESRLVRGLYFAGELLDIDGDCGGYDLQAAWSTGALAAASMGGESGLGTKAAGLG